MSKTNMFHMRISKKDRRRLELICAAYNCSMAGAIRASLAATCEKLGFETGLPEDAVK